MDFGYHVYNASQTTIGSTENAELMGVCIQPYFLPGLSLSYTFQIKCLCNACSTELDGVIPDHQFLTRSRDMVLTFSAILFPFRQTAKDKSCHFFFNHCLKYILKETIYKMQLLDLIHRQSHQLLVCYPSLLPVKTVQYSHGSVIIWLRGMKEQSL